MKAFTALIVLAMAAPAMASEGKAGDTQPQAAPASTQKKERKVCKREETSLGLHGSRRICMTAAEWRERNHNDSEDDQSGVSTR